MTDYAIAKYTGTCHSLPPKVSVDTNPTPPRTVPTLMPQAIVYISLGLAIFITLRGDTPQIALILPYLAGVLQLILKARSAAEADAQSTTPTNPHRKR